MKSGQFRWELVERPVVVPTIWDFGILTFGIRYFGFRNSEFGISLLEVPNLRGFFAFGGSVFEILAFGGLEFRIWFLGVQNWEF